MNNNKKSETGRCYVSLSIYSKSDIEKEVSRELLALPSRIGFKNGTYSWRYTTNGNGEADSVEGNLKLLKETLHEFTGKFEELSSQGLLFRLWIYFEMASVNKAFVIDDDVVRWLNSFGADIYIDIYNWGLMESEP